MKKAYNLLIFCFHLLTCILFTNYAVQAQSKPANSNTSSQAEMRKMMEAAMKNENMSEAEKAQMRKAMKGMMPAIIEKVTTMADYPEFSRNLELVPKKDPAKISLAKSKKLSQSDMKNYATTLYNKIMVRGEASEITLVKKIMAQTPAADDCGNTAVLCMMQGHGQAALALSMKAVQLDPLNLNWQNNMASLLTQYGYPEYALSVLNNLELQLPGNSTILNNKAYAWLGLGDKDSAALYANVAGFFNPNHPDAAACGGLMQELKGDPVDASKNYVRSMETAPSVTVKKMMQHAGGKPEEVGFDKLKSCIAIYEYFPRDWIKIPEITNEVSAYTENMAIKNGYEKMHDEFQDNLQKMLDEYNKNIMGMAKSMEKADDETIRKMIGAGLGKEMLNGRNWMSETATIVIEILHNYLNQWTDSFLKEKKELFESIEARRPGPCNEPCQSRSCDINDNQFMNWANPKILRFYEVKIEEIRQYANVFCTWYWYIVGNPEHTAETACLGATGILQGIYKTAMQDLIILPPNCSDFNSNGVKEFSKPKIPNFNCPAVVSIPFGKEWQELRQSVSDLNNNKSGIKMKPEPIPNSSIAYGLSGSGIPEAGKNPGIKTSEGNLTYNIFSEGNWTLNKTFHGEIPTFEEYFNKNWKFDELESYTQEVKDDFYKKVKEIYDEKVGNTKAVQEIKEIQRKKSEAQEMAGNLFFFTMISISCEESNRRSEEAQVMKRLLQKLREAVREEARQELEKGRQQKNAKDPTPNKDQSSNDKQLEEAIRQDREERIKNEQESQQKENNQLEEAIKEGREERLKNEAATKQLEDALEQSMQERIQQLENIVNKMDSSGFQASISSGMQVPGTFKANPALFK